jgi:hypothetical protein
MSRNADFVPAGVRIRAATYKETHQGILVRLGRVLRAHRARLVFRQTPAGVHTFGLVMQGDGGSGQLFGLLTESPFTLSEDTLSRPAQETLRDVNRLLTETYTQLIMLSQAVTPSKVLMEIGGFNSGLTKFYTEEDWDHALTLEPLEASSLGF